MRVLRNAALACLLVSLSTLTLTSTYANNGKIYGKGHPFTIDQLPPGQFKQDLKALPEAAQKNAVAWMNENTYTDLDFVYLRVDKQGGVFFEDPAFEGSEAELSESTPVLEELSLIETFSLHSKPGASRTVFIDMDGREVTGTIWNANSGADPLIMRPYDSDGDESSFTQTELNQIAETWRRVAEDFAPFDVDVTTEDPGQFGPNVGVLLITKKTDVNGNVIYNCGCGGVAYVNVWGRSDFEYYQPALVFTEGVGTGAHNMSEAGSHEVGHNLGLSHDGNDTTGYYRGHGEGNVSWAPIMGVGYYEEVTQWSKGEYLNANQTQDDMAIITDKLSAGGDDHGDTRAQATPLSINSGSVVATSPVIDPFNFSPVNKGVIETQDDLDVFSFDSGSGTVDLTITPGWFEVFATSNNRGMNIDIQATLYDSSGTVITSSNPLDDTFAQITANVPAGTYYLEIDGVGLGDPLGTGYTDYGSLGNYFVNGTVPESNPGTPTANFTTSCDQLSCNFDGSTSFDNDGSITSYTWDLGDGTSSSDAVVNHTYATAGTYTVSLTVTDNDGLSDTQSQDVTVTVPVPPTASFTSSCSDLDCSFDASASSDDASITSFSWDYGDGSTGTGVTSSHSYESAGTYTVTLTVTDSDGLTDTSQSTVTATEPPQAPPAAPSDLTASSVKEGRGKNATLISVTLNWTDNSDNETGFEIERCVETGKGKNKACNYSAYAAVGVNTTSFTDSSPVTNARYRVRSVNEIGVSNYSNSVEP